MVSRNDVAGLQKKLQNDKSTYKKRIGDLYTEVVGYFNSIQPSGNIDSLIVSLQTVKSALDTHGTLSQKIDLIESNIKTDEKRVQVLTKEIDELLSNWGLDSEQITRLPVLVEQSRELQELITKHTLLEREIVPLKTKSGKFSDKSLEELQQLINQQTKLKDELPDLYQEKHEIKAKLEESLNGNTVQRANENHQIACENMAQSRDETIRKLVRNELVKWLKENEIPKTTPELLRLVQDNFNRFTDHQYNLKVVNGSFAIYDHKSSVGS